MPITYIKYIDTLKIEKWLLITEDELDNSKNNKELENILEIAYYSMKHSITYSCQYYRIDILLIAQPLLKE